MFPWLNVTTGLRVGWTILWFFVWLLTIKELSEFLPDNHLLKADEQYLIENAKTNEDTATNGGNERRNPSLPPVDPMGDAIGDPYTL